MDLLCQARDTQARGLRVPRMGAIQTPIVSVDLTTETQPLLYSRH